jgi:hypothetical protein
MQGDPLPDDSSKSSPLKPTVQRNSLASNGLILLFGLSIITSLITLANLTKMTGFYALAISSSSALNIALLSFIGIASVAALTHYLSSRKKPKDAVDNLAPSVVLGSMALSTILSAFVDLVAELNPEPIQWFQYIALGALGLFLLYQLGYVLLKKKIEKIEKEENTPPIPEPFTSFADAKNLQKEGLFQTLYQKLIDKMNRKVIQGCLYITCGFSIFYMSVYAFTTAHIAFNAATIGVFLGIVCNILTRRVIMLVQYVLDRIDKIEMTMIAKELTTYKFEYDKQKQANQSKKQSDGEGEANAKQAQKEPKTVAIKTLIDKFGDKQNVEGNNEKSELDKAYPGIKKAVFALHERFRECFDCYLNSMIKSENGPTNEKPSLFSIDKERFLANIKRVLLIKNLLDMLGDDAMPYIKCAFYEAQIEEGLKLVQAIEYKKNNSEQSIKDYLDSLKTKPVSVENTGILNEFTQLSNLLKQTDEILSSLKQSSARHKLKDLRDRLKTAIGTAANEPAAGDAPATSDAGDAAGKKILEALAAEDETFDTTKLRSLAQFLNKNGIAELSNMLNDDHAPHEEQEASDESLNKIAKKRMPKPWIVGLSLAVMLIGASGEFSKVWLLIKDNSIPHLFANISPLLTNTHLWLGIIILYLLFDQIPYSLWFAAVPNPSVAFVKRSSNSSASWPRVALNNAKKILIDLFYSLKSLFFVALLASTLYAASLIHPALQTTLLVFTCLYLLKLTYEKTFEKLLHKINKKQSRKSLPTAWLNTTWNCIKKIFEFFLLFALAGGGTFGIILATMTTLINFARSLYTSGAMAEPPKTYPKKKLLPKKYQDNKLLLKIGIVSVCLMSCACVWSNWFDAIGYIAHFSNTVGVPAQFQEVFATFWAILGACTFMAVATGYLLNFMPYLFSEKTCQEVYLEQRYWMNGEVFNPSTKEANNPVKQNKAKNPKAEEQQDDHLKNEDELAKGTFAATT